MTNVDHLSCLSYSIPDEGPPMDLADTEVLSTLLGREMHAISDWRCVHLAAKRVFPSKGTQLVRDRRSRMLAKVTVTERVKSKSRRTEFKVADNFEVTCDRDDPRVGAFQSHLKALSGSFDMECLRFALLNLMEEEGCVMLRSGGGLYWVPADARVRFSKVHEAAASVGAEIDVFRLQDDPDTVSWLAKQAVRGLESDWSRVQKEMARSRFVRSYLLAGRFRGRAEGAACADLVPTHRKSKLDMLQAVDRRMAEIQAENPVAIAKSKAV